MADLNIGSGAPQLARPSAQPARPEGAANSAPIGNTRGAEPPLQARAANSAPIGNAGGAGPQPQPRVADAAPAGDAGRATRGTEALQRSQLSDSPEAANTKKKEVQSQAQKELRETASKQGLQTYSKSFGAGGITGRAINQAVSASKVELSAAGSIGVAAATASIGPLLHGRAAASSGPDSSETQLVPAKPGMALSSDQKARAFQPFHAALSVGNTVINTTQISASSVAGEKGAIALGVAGNAALFIPGSIAAVKTVNNIMAESASIGFSLQEPIKDDEGKTIGKFTSHQSPIPIVDEDGFHTGQVEVAKITLGEGDNQLTQSLRTERDGTDAIRVEYNAGQLGDVPLPSKEEPKSTLQKTADFLNPTPWTNAARDTANAVGDTAKAVYTAMTDAPLEALKSAGTTLKDGLVGTVGAIQDLATNPVTRTKVAAMASTVVYASLLTSQIKNDLEETGATPLVSNLVAAATANAMLGTEFIAKFEFFREPGNDGTLRALAPIGLASLLSGQTGGFETMTEHKLENIAEGKAVAYAALQSSTPGAVISNDNSLSIKGSVLQDLV